MWLQLMEHAKEVQQSIIFVSRDSKEDWWLHHKGRVLMPRPELRREFAEYTGQEFYMYSTLNFIERAKKAVNTKLPDALIEEAREMSIRRARRESDIDIDILDSKNLKQISLLDYIKDMADFVGGPYPSTPALRLRLAQHRLQLSDQKLSAKLEEIRARINKQSSEHNATKSGPQLNDELHKLLLERIDANAKLLEIKQEIESSDESLHPPGEDRDDTGD